jgi:type II secretory pathway component GspD/PulD (secretin)
VTPLVISNKLLLQETVGNIERIRATVEDMEQNGSAGSLQHRCVHVDARDAVAVLKELLPDRPESSEPGRAFGITNPAVETRRPYRIAVDERLNSVLVTGPADRVAAVRSFLRTIDVPLDEGPTGGTVRVINLRRGSAIALAEELERMLKQMYPHNPIKVITPGGEADKRP